MEKINEILAVPLLGNELKTYVIALIVLGLIFLFFKFMFMIFFKRLEKYAKKTKTDIDDAVVKVLEENRWVGFFVIILLYVELAIKLSATANEVISALFNIVIVLLVIRIANYWVSYGVNKYVQQKKQTAEKFSIQLIGKILKVLVWVFGILFLISAFGYNISSLVAGLGIGGIAVALAVQNILGDLISAVSIYLDKPFKVGDYITVGTQSGTVKNIGLKTTRITTLQGEELVVSNKKLTEGEINNFGKMKKRRIVVPLGVTYDTNLNKMKKVPQALKKIIKSVKDTTFDRAHFKTYGDFSKNFELVFYVESKDYATYMDRLSEINLKIQEFFEKEKIEFAYPTQTIYVKK